MIGSKLHPLQSAADLAKGPLDGPAAGIESELLGSREKSLLVGHACTRIGLLVGLSVATLLIAGLGWRWYLGVPLGYVIMFAVGASLKLAFKAI